MIVENGSLVIGETEAIEVRSVIRPERIQQTRSFQRSQSGVFMEVQRAALDSRAATPIALIHGDLRTTLLQEPGQREPARAPADNRDPLSDNGTHGVLRFTTTA